jgi:hypothetical protein
LAASCGKLVATESTQEQNVCRAGEDKSNQKEEEGRNRRRRLTARARRLANCKRRRKIKAGESDLIGRPFFQGRTLNDWRLRTAMETESCIIVQGRRQPRQLELFLRKAFKLFCVVRKTQLLVLRRGWRLTPNCAA